MDASGSIEVRGETVIDFVGGDGPVVVSDEEREDESRFVGTVGVEEEKEDESRFEEVGVDVDMVSVVVVVVVVVIFSSRGLKQ